MELSNDEIRRMLRKNLVQSEGEIAQHLREVCHLTQEDWPDTRLLAHTQRGLDRAISQGLTTQQDVLAFLALRHQYGERFDEFPAVRNFLARTDLAVGNRIPQMFLELPLALWDVVGRRTQVGESGPFNPKEKPVP